VTTTAYDTLIDASSLANGVPFAWIKAVIATESGFDTQAYRDEGWDQSYGLMQLLYSTAKKLGFSGDAVNLYDPAINISLGARLLKQLIASWGRNFDRVYSAYNSGQPDAYLTNNEVAAHVNRARNFLQVIEAEQAAVGETPEEPPVETPGTMDIVLLLALGAAAVWLFVLRK
jgi:soluble lytic murein transglycosylase-like protein